MKKWISILVLVGVSMSLSACRTPPPTSPEPPPPDQPNPPDVPTTSTNVPVCLPDDPVPRCDTFAFFEGPNQEYDRAHEALIRAADCMGLEKPKLAEVGMRFFHHAGLGVSRDKWWYDEQFPGEGLVSVHGWMQVISFRPDFVIEAHYAVDPDHLNTDAARADASTLVHESTHIMDGYDDARLEGHPDKWGPCFNMVERTLSFFRALVSRSQASEPEISFFVLGPGGEVLIDERKDCRTWK